MSNTTRPADGGSSLAWIGAAARTRRPMLAACLLVGVIGLSIVNFRARSFTANASFIPQAPGGTRASISGLAAQFGFSVPGAEASASPAFYADLLKSEEIVRGVIETRYRFSADGEAREGNLIELLGVDGANDAVKMELAAARVRTLVGVLRNRETGLIRLSYKAPWPELAQQVAQRFLDLLNEFNLERRQSQAAAERKFVEGRLAEVQGELRAAEGRLQAFLSANRDYRNSPRLAFEQERLNEDVVARRQVVTSLVQAFEQARIDQVRDTPVITVVEAPLVPATADPRGLVRNAILGLLFGGMLFIGLAFVMDQRAARRADGH